MNKLLVILGPTATGKTDLALDLAKEFKGELIACDSRQVYKGLDIGTGKYPSGISNQIIKHKGFWEIGEIRVWMYDVTSLKSRYSVFNFVKDASKVVDDIVKRDKLPIIVGGTGLYLKALVDGLANLSIPEDLKLRKELEKLDLLELQQKLQEISLDRWNKMNSSDQKNSRRLLRSIEIASMYPYMGNKKIKGLSEKFDILKIGLTSTRENLFIKSDLRVLDWFDQGIIEEVRNLTKNGISLKRIKDLGLEYKIIAESLESKITPPLINLVQTSVRRYIKRQLTWFKRDSDINWFDVAKNNKKTIEKSIRYWYN